MPAPTAHPLTADAVTANPPIAVAPTGNRPSFRRVFVAPPDLGAAALGLLFWAESLRPGLLPRPAVMQGVLSAVALLLGYGIAGLVLLALRAQRWAPPAWTRDPRGPDIPPQLGSFPFVTWTQVSADLIEGFNTPPGHGHNFNNAFAAGVAAQVAPTGWTAADTARLDVVLARIADGEPSL